MTRPELPDFDLDELMRKVHAKVEDRRGRQFAGAEPAWQRGVGAGLSPHIRRLSAEVAEGLNLIRHLSTIRTNLPRSLNRFPFDRIALLRKFILKVYELLFREQRAVNNAVADTLDKIHQIGRMSSDGLGELASLEASLKALEARVNETIAGLQAQLADEQRIRSQMEQQLQRLAQQHGPTDRESAERQSGTDTHEVGSSTKNREQIQSEPDTQ